MTETVTGYTPGGFPWYGPVSGNISASGSVVIGTSPTTGEVLVKNYMTGDMSWMPGTSAQIAAVTDAINAAGEFGSISYPDYVAPTAPTPTPTPTPVVPPVTPTPVVPYVPPAPVTGIGIFDAIINYIKNAIDTIVSTLISWWTTVSNAIITTITGWIDSAVSTLTGWLTDIRSWVASIYDWVQRTYNVIESWVSNAWTTVYSAASSAIDQVRGLIQDRLDALTSWVSGALGDLRAWVSVKLDSVNSYIDAIWGGIQDNFAWLTGFLPAEIERRLGGWWDTFIARVLDFPSWVGGLFDAASAWLTVDVPGHSPRWTGIFEAIGHWFATWFYDFPKYFFGDFPERVAYGLGESFKWITEGLTPLVDTFLTSIDQFAQTMGPQTPDKALVNARTLTKVGLATVTGLFGMTVAGELLHPLKNLGLGNLAAIIYDLTNYKMLTGAFVGVLAAAAIQQPLRYYYNNLFRPYIPREGEASAMFARDRLTSQEYRQILGYQGIANQWHENYEDLAYRPMSLVALSTLCSSGGFDESMVTQVLIDRGINPKWRPAMLDLYRKKGQDTVKGAMSSVPLSRYRQGYTDAGGFRDEMGLLAYTDTEIDKYQVGADLAYATDYIADLISAWQTQVRKKVISLADFRTYLATVIKVPDRIDALVMREIVNAPVEEPKAVGMSVAVNRFKEGMTVEDTFRDELTLLGCPPADMDRSVQAAQLLYSYDLTMDLITAYTDAVRYNRIDLGQFRDVLLGLGLVPERVEARVLIEQSRIDPTKKTTVPKPVLRFYETDQGKVREDTIRRQRRQHLLTRDEEIAALIGIGMTPDYATDIAGNDDLRLQKTAALEE